MAVITSLEDWWSKCNANWENMLDIFQKVGAPMGRDEEDHWWSDVFGKPSARHDKCLTQTLEDLKTARDGQGLHHLMYLAWHAASDKGRMHNWKGWIVFCDLISEDWVFEEVVWPKAHRTPS